MSEEKLWSELYLLEPDWLAMEVCRKLTHEEYPAGAQSDSGMRGITNLLGLATITDVSEEASTDQMEVETPADTPQKKKPFKRNKYGESPLHSACRSGDVEKAKEFLDKYGVSFVNYQDHNGWTAMHEACKYGRIQCVQLLMDTGVVSFESKDNEEGVMPIQDAIMSNHIEVVKMILKHCHSAGKLHQALYNKTSFDNNSFDLSKEEEMTNLLNEYKDIHKAPFEHTIIVKNPLRFVVLSNMFLYRYAATFRLHAVKSELLNLVNKPTKFSSAVNLEFSNPIRQLEKKKCDKCDKKEKCDEKKCVEKNPLYPYPLYRDPQICAEDIRSFWHHASKPIVYLPVFKVICD